MRRHKRFDPALLPLVGVLLLAGCQAGPGPRSTHQPEPLPPVTTETAVITDDTQVIGRIQVLMARHQDTLPDIARRFGLGYEEIVAANPGVDPWLPGEGTRVVLPTRFVLPNTKREGVVLNVASMRLFYYPPAEPGEPATVITHPVGIGREGWATPLGRTHVTSKAEDPAWYVPASVLAEHAAKGDPLPAVVPPGPENPLGAHALRLAMPSYLIHGTNKPYGVGMRVSHGCVRMYPEDIAALFADIPVGTAVHIVNQPYLVGISRGWVELEVHRPLSEDGGSFDRSYLSELLDSRSELRWAALDHERIEALLASASGIPAPVQLGAPPLEVVIGSAPVVRNERPQAVRLARGDG